jgi:two-component system, sensor histidine kinase and response regulator
MTIHILAAGSHPQYAALAKLAFEELDCQIIPATSMTLAIFLAQKNLPDVILCDFEMTDGDGWSFIKEIKADAELRTIPFVFIGTVDDASISDRASALGADAVLSFPLDASQLKREIIPYINIRLAEKGQRLPQTPE